MQLWTIQPLEWYEKLMDEGVIHGHKEYVYEDFSQAYHWLMNKMDDKIGVRPFSECYPVWAWYQYLGKNKRKPDLRNRGFLSKGKKGVRIEIKKQENDILLSDFELWHYPLNYLKIDDSLEESNEFDRLLEINGINFIDRENYTLPLREIVEKSWDKVLDMDYCPDFTARLFAEKSIQATFWTLSMDEIVKVEHFAAR